LTNINLLLYAHYILISKNIQVLTFCLFDYILIVLIVFGKDIGNRLFYRKLSQGLDTTPGLATTPRGKQNMSNTNCNHNLFYYLISLVMLTVVYVVMDQ